MGKKNILNGIASCPDAKEQHIWSVTSFFKSKTVGEQQQQNQDAPCKMFDNNSEMEAESSFSTKDNLKALENALVEKIATLLQPIQKQLNTMNAALN